MAESLTCGTFAVFLVILPLQLWPQSSAIWLAMLSLFSAMWHFCYVALVFFPGAFIVVPLHCATLPHSFVSSSVFWFVLVDRFFVSVPSVLHLLLHSVPPRFFTLSLLASSTQGVLLWLLCFFPIYVFFSPVWCLADFAGFFSRLFSFFFWFLFFFGEKCKLY